MSSSERRFPRDVSQLGEIFAFVDERLGAWQADERTAYRVHLVVEELFTNFVKYNRDGRGEIDISVARVGSTVHIDLVDPDTDPFDPTAVAEPPLGAGVGERRPGGLGLHLVRSMVDSLDHDYDPAARTLRVSVSTRLEH